MTRALDRLADLEKKHERLFIMLLNFEKRIKRIETKVGRMYTKKRPKKLAHKRLKKAMKEARS